MTTSPAAPPAPSAGLSRPAYTLLTAAMAVCDAYEAEWQDVHRQRFEQLMSALADAAVDAAAHHIIGGNHGQDS